MSDFQPLKMPDIHAKWGWFVALGAALLFFGVIAFANLMVATAASVFYVGLLMLMGGVIHLIHAFQVKGWENILFWTLSGVLYLLAGIIAFQNPNLTAAVLTLMMAIALVITGISRMWLGFKLRPLKSWGWIVLAGAVTTLAGFIIALGWPVNSIWVLGLFLSIDLMMQGWALIALGLAMKS